MPDIDDILVQGWES